jgi:hypothetical protein
VRSYDGETDTFACRGKIEIDGIDPAKVTYITEDVGYWRKANAVHRWFVEEVHDGKDDCREYVVGEAQLRELLTRVEAMLPTLMLSEVAEIDVPITAQELLPVQDGFFFGSTEYDPHCIESLQKTQRIVTEALSMPGGGDFYYQSSS